MFITVSSIWLFRSNLFLLIMVFISVCSILVSCTNFTMSYDIGLLIGEIVECMAEPLKRACQGDDLN